MKTPPQERSTKKLRQEAAAAGTNEGRSLPRATVRSEHVAAEEPQKEDAAARAIKIHSLPRLQRPKSENGDLRLGATGGDRPSCHHQTARSGLLRRPAIICSGSPIAEDREDFAGFRDPEDPTCQERRHYPAGVEDRACHVRQPGPTCRGGSLPFKASRRLPWTK